MSSRSESNKKPQSEDLDPMIRRCLMCFAEFLSEHKGERVCRACKGTSAWRQG